MRVWSLVVLLLVASLVLTGAPVRAADPRIARLYALMQVSETIQIQQEEGMRNAQASAPELFDGALPEGWAQAVARAYERERMEEIVRTALAQGLEGVDLTPLLDFYASPLGRKMVALEQSGRRVFLDPDVEEEARRMWRDAPEAAPHAQAIRTYMQVNDLVERNVIAAMNADFTFLRAYFEGDSEINEALILSDVWSEEENIRADSAEWLFAYLAMAYGPLTPEEMQASLALWHTPEGRALNNALLDGFSAMVVAISRDLGHSAGQILAGQDL